MFVLASPSAEPRRILVRGVNWVGDAVMTTPALGRLRERFPRARITLLTPEKLADLWREHPSIDEIMIFAGGQSVWSVGRRIRNWQVDKLAGELGERRWGVGGPLRAAMAESVAAMAEMTLKVLSSLRGGNPPPVDLEPVHQRAERHRQLQEAYSASPFDLAVILPNSPRAALETWLGRVPQRVGYARPWRNWFLTRPIASRAEGVVMRKRSARQVRRRQSAPEPPGAPAAAAHQMHDYLHLVGALGAKAEPLPPMLEVTAGEVEQARKAFLADLPGQGQGEAPGLPLLLGLNPGAEYGPAKRWPAAGFAAVVREVCRRRGGCVWLVFGGAKERELCAEIARAAGGRAANLAGRTSLRELMALLKLCRVLLANDTGPMHLAAALGTPVVVPFGSTSPELTGPGLPGDPRHRLLRSEAGCAPCFRRTCPLDFRCLRGVSAERVVEAVWQAISPD